MNETLTTLARVFVPLSLVSFGGGRTILPDIETQAVAGHGWLSHREFVELFAISRAAPSPGTVLVTLVGWKAAGWLGAPVASLAIYLPAGLLVVGAALLFRHHLAASWRNRIERALAPIAVGLLLAGAVSILNATGGGVLAYAVAAASAAVLWWHRIHPLLLLGGGVSIYGGVFLFTHGAAGNTVFPLQ